MKRVVVHSKRRVFDRFFQIDEAELSYERFDGTMSEPVRRLCFERGDALAAIVFDSNSRRAILVKQFRYPTYDKGPGWIVEAVAGMVERNETPESALRREVLEEIGYRIDSLTPIDTFYVSPGGSSERVLLYFAEVSAAGKLGGGGGVPTEGEDIETVSYSLEELRALCETASIHDAKTLIGIQWLLNRLPDGKV